MCPKSFSIHSYLKPIIISQRNFFLCFVMKTKQNNTKLTWWFRARPWTQTSLGWNPPLDPPLPLEQPIRD